MKWSLSETDLKRIRSFTLTEVLIATVLSAILLALIVTIFSFLVDRIHAENKKMNQMEELLLLQTGLQEAARQCDSVIMTDNRIMFSGPATKRVYLQFADSLVVLCIGEACDTFGLTAKELRYTTLGNTSLISGIEFEVGIRTFSVPVSLIKEYDGKTLVNSGITRK